MICSIIILLMPAFEIHRSLLFSKMPKKSKPGTPDYRNAQFSLCCTSTAMPDDESEESTSGILFSIEQSESELRFVENRLAFSHAQFRRR
jgi:hypothetical protein